MAPTTTSAEMIDVTVRLNHYSTIAARKGDRYVKVSVRADGSESVYALKQKISEGLTFNAFSPEDMRLLFGPIDVNIGKEFKDDPYVDEKKMKISQFSFLEWIKRFPEWYLTVKAMPETPPPPGVAEVIAASSLDGLGPEEAVAKARKEGKLARVADLQKPWGEKPPEFVPDSQLVTLKKIPGKYPASSHPSVNMEGVTLP